MKPGGGECHIRLDVIMCFFHFCYYLDTCISTCRMNCYWKWCYVVILVRVCSRCDVAGPGNPGSDDLEHFCLI